MFNSGFSNSGHRPAVLVDTSRPSEDSRQRGITDNKGHNFTFKFVKQ